MVVKYDDFSAEELGQMAKAKGIACRPSAVNREDIIKKLKALEKPKPSE